MLGISRKEPAIAERTGLAPHFCSRPSNPHACLPQVTPFGCTKGMAYRYNDSTGFAFLLFILGAIRPARSSNCRVSQVPVLADSPAHIFSLVRLTGGPLLAMLLKLFPILFLHVAPHAFGLMSEDPPIVDLGYARYQGVSNVETGNTEFLGIRYAAPPTGKARWREPRLPDRVDDLQKADTQPNRCQQAFGSVDRPNIQKSGVDATTAYGEGSQQVLGQSNVQWGSVVPPVSEDCLFLNVVTPGLNFSSTSSEKLPVVVWIHGGGYSLGSISFPGVNGMRIYDGNDLVNDSGGNVIAVLIQYRLGLFGFLAGSDVKKDGVLNAGLRDQQFALEWIQRHISRFGGDPERVTVWGQSAGAGSILQHMIANSGKTDPSLFSAAILSSTFLPSQYQYNAKIPEVIYTQVLNGAGCENAHDRLDCLRDTDLATLQKVNSQVAQQTHFGIFVFVPVVDGDLIRESPLRALKNGRLGTKNILAVATTNEGRMFIDPEMRDSVDVGDFLSKLFPMFRGDQVHLALKHYENLGDPFEQVIRIVGDAIFACPTYYILDALKGNGYKGEFAIPPGDHIDDVLYYFPSITESGPPFNNSAFSSTFSGTFMDFVRKRDPNTKSPGSILPHWPKWDRWYRTEMAFNRTGDAPDVKTVTTEQALLERCEAVSLDYCRGKVHRFFSIPRVSKNAVKLATFTPSVHDTRNSPTPTETMVTSLCCPMSDIERDSSPSPYPPSTPSFDSDSDDDRPSLRMSSGLLRATLNALPERRLREIVLRLADSDSGFRQALQKEVTRVDEPETPPATPTHASQRRPRSKKGRKTRQSRSSEGKRPTAPMRSPPVVAASPAPSTNEEHDHLLYHPGHLEDEVYEFVSRTPNGAAFKVIQTVTMWSCCNEDEWSEGCILITPTFDRDTEMGSHPHSGKLAPLDTRPLPEDDVFPDSDLESPYSSDLLTPVSPLRGRSIA
ncbi:hypothetical protein NMY22_g3532 [Coprinellus aureogranulatus]|nr:hypothetical protein NMY22_g3532 [Coprinellus aureogranulatus]